MSNTAPDLAARSLSGVTAAVTSVVPPGQPDSQAEFQGYGVKLRIPLPRWAVSALAALLVVGLIGAGAYVGVKFIGYVPVSRDVLNEYIEFGNHIGDLAEQRQERSFDFPDGTQVTIVHFKRDGCNQIVRSVPSIQKSDGLWMFGPSLTPDKRPALDVRDTSSTAIARAGLGRAIETVERALVQPVGAAGRSCLDPHPGPFEQKAVADGQCRTKVWRYFRDGCVHYQFYNPCSGTWDVLPNGAPRVYWDRCNH